MENVFIKGTDRTAEIDFDFDKGILSISGRSIPENPTCFYENLESLIISYAKAPQPKTIIKVNLEYFNTSSSKCLVDLFKEFEKIHSSKSEVLVEWYYEQDDEEIKDSGEDYKDIVDIPFEIKLLT
ncbi:hypothetical protein MNBD_GAMMA03-1445 [hydrothermal vent metagenome]|uniref:SiaC family regulatory phosphoprotein domain-containing protein n=1 Tax=hydrothermal vent metagenome TaxID=652676 RepID=A0A3B0WBJ8_9ZZZZ